MNRKSCKGCIYQRSISGMSKSDMVCCYSIDTPGYKIRQCQPKKCNVRKEKSNNEKPV